MSTTNVDMSIGLNLTIGSVPVSLNATIHTEGDDSVYSFTGCVQEATLDIGSFMSYIGQQFQVDVELPPELDLRAEFDYIAGQIIQTQKNGKSESTEMGFSAKFELYYGNSGDSPLFSMQFYADSISKPSWNENVYVVGGSIDTDLKFSSLPLVGDVPIFKDYTLKHLGFSYTNAEKDPDGNPVSFNIPKVDTSSNPLYTRESDESREKVNYEIVNEGQQTTFTLGKKGFAFTAGLMKEDDPDSQGNFTLPMALPPATNWDTPAQYYQTSGEVQTSPPASSINWIDVNKTFGPVDFRKVGLNYSGGSATFGLSAGFSLGAFSMDLEGLSITFPLPLPNMPADGEVSFDLDGLGMQYSQGGFSIGGNFLKMMVDDRASYFGQVIVKTATVGFKALGGYTPEYKTEKQTEPASFFLYANLQVPIGGPPYLYVSGLAFGFGINRTLILPTIATLPGYPLLPNLAPKEKETPEQTIAEVIPALADIMREEPGQYWVAAGVQFTSFDMVSAFVLVTVAFGVNTQIGILGTCSVTLPKGASEPLAYIEIDLVASFTPSTGLLAVEGVISPASYLYGDFVKLTGGFAFYIWFSGDHKGDFIVTLGGYHPAFNKPDWYPTVPRLALKFALGPFQAEGQAYVALMPSMFQAGLYWNATFSVANIKAWFITGVDFLIAWAPYYYEASAYINVGCSVDLGLFTLKVSVGAQLDIWGPSFGGKALIDLDVVSFTIKFGSEAKPPAPVSWNEIEQNFLPKADNSSNMPRKVRRAQGQTTQYVAAGDETTANVTASVGVGLLQTDTEGYDWILNPDDFTIRTATSIPANQAKWYTADDQSTDITNDKSAYNSSTVDVSTEPYLELADGTTTYSDSQVWNPKVSVRPMNLEDVQSIHTVALLEGNNQGGYDYITTVAIEPVLLDSAAALWGQPEDKPNANSDSFVAATLVGFDIIPLPRYPNTVNDLLLTDLIYTFGNETQFGYTYAQPDTRYTVTSEITPEDYDLDITVSGAADKEFNNEDYILSTIIDEWVSEQRDEILSDLRENGFDTYRPEEVDLTNMGTTENLTDWPMVGILGETNS